MIKSSIRILLLWPLLAHAHPLVFSGQLTAYPLEALLCASDGYIAEVSVHEGQSVQPDQWLGTLQTTALATELEEVEGQSAQLEEKKQQLDDWDSAPEMLLASQQYQQAQQHAQKACYRAQTDEGLYQKGIISREEYDNDQQQCQTQKMSLEIAQRHYQATAQKAAPQERARLDKQIQRVAQRHERLMALDASSTLRAHHAGRLWLADPEKPFREGERCSAGDTLAYIVAEDKVIIRLKVDEFDILQIKVGAQANVRLNTHPDQVLSAEVIAVAEQAEKQGTIATYPVEVLLAVDQSPMPPWRFGMSAMVEIVDATAHSL